MVQFTNHPLASVGRQGPPGPKRSTRYRVGGGDADWEGELI